MDILLSQRHMVDGIEYFMVGEDLRDKDHPWFGFSLMPGLRRKVDYDRIKPFSSCKHSTDFPALSEWRIGMKYYELGYRTAFLQGEYCDNIGQHKKNLGESRTLKSIYRRLHKNRRR